MILGISRLTQQMSLEYKFMIRSCQDSPICRQVGAPPSNVPANPRLSTHAKAHRSARHSSASGLHLSPRKRRCDNTIFYFQFLMHVPSVRKTGDGRNPIAPISEGTCNPTRALCPCANTENPVRLLTCQNVDGLSANVPMGFRHDSSEKE
jgi:hypothetical protein